MVPYGWPMRMGVVSPCLSPTAATAWTCRYRFRWSPASASPVTTCVTSTSSPVRAAARTRTAAPCSERAWTLRVCHWRLPGSHWLSRRLAIAHSDKGKPMLETRQLGNCGLSVSRLCLGTMNFGEPGRGHQGDWTLPIGEARPIFKAALDHGLFYFDCADVYGLGACEQVV